MVTPLFACFYSGSFQIPHPSTGSKRVHGVHGESCGFETPLLGFTISEKVRGKEANFEGDSTAGESSH